MLITLATIVQSPDPNKPALQHIEGLKNNPQYNNVLERAKGKLERNNSKTNFQSPNNFANRQKVEFQPKDSLLLGEEEGKNKFKNLVDSNEILRRHRSNENLPKLPIDRKRVEVPFEDSLLINKGKNSKSKNKRSRSKSINMKKNKGHY